MPDALPLPDDLVDLQRACLTAEQQLADYVHETETRRRAEFPDAEQVVQRVTWSEAETAEHLRLRAARDELATQVRRHPVIVQALAERCWPQTWEALREACRA